VIYQMKPFLVTLRDLESHFSGLKLVYTLYLW